MPVSREKNSNASRWMLPEPVEPYVILPGARLACATNSFTVLASTLRLMASTCGVVATSVIGESSLIAYGSEA